MILIEYYSPHHDFPSGLKIIKLKFGTHFEKVENMLIAKFACRFYICLRLRIKTCFSDDFRGIEID